MFPFILNKHLPHSVLGMNVFDWSKLKQTHTEWKHDLKGDSRDGLGHPAICYSPAQIPEHPKKRQNHLVLSLKLSWLREAKYIIIKQGQAQMQEMRRKKYCWNFNTCTYNMCTRLKLFIWANHSLPFVYMELTSLRPRVGWSVRGFGVCWTSPYFQDGIFGRDGSCSHLSSARVIGQLGKKCAAGWVNLKDPIKLTYLHMETC